VLNSTALIVANCYSAHMSSEPVVDERFQERWAASQARGVAHDRTRRTLFILVAILSLSAVILSVW
jgi:hypothetical protein